jgi:hypothetical protein
MASRKSKKVKGKMDEGFSSMAVRKLNNYSFPGIEVLIFWKCRN